MSQIRLTFDLAKLEHIETREEMRRHVEDLTDNITDYIWERYSKRIDVINKIKLEQHYQEVMRRIDAQTTASNQGSS